MKTILIPNKNNINSKSKFKEDYYFEIITKLLINEIDNPYIHNNIKRLFNFTSVEQYEKLSANLIKLMDSTTYKEHYPNIFLCNIFKIWKPYEKYNLGECKGYFFELFTYKLLNRLYNENKLYLETSFKIGNYYSHTWDIILKILNVYYCYECKFSLKYFKRKHLNQMLSLKNNLNNSNLYLVTYHSLPLAKDCFERIKENTSKDKYENMLNQINLVTLDDFCRGNSFVYKEMINNT